MRRSDAINLYLNQKEAPQFIRLSVAEVEERIREIASRASVSLSRGSELRDILDLIHTETIPDEESYRIWAEVIKFLYFIDRSVSPSE